jgi:uracil-DNA glycosylase family 4
MQGFFTKKDTTSTTRPDGKIYSCISCGLYKNCHSPRMEPYGNFKKRILVIGESPSITDDEYNKPFQDKYGRILKHTFEQYGIDLFEDCLSINALNCFTESDPSLFEIESCRKFKLQIINQYKPRLIIVLGDAALKSIVGGRWKKDLGSIYKWQGFQIPDQEFMAWICPTFHPNMIEHSSPVVKVLFEQDIQQAFYTLENIRFTKTKEPEIEIIENLYPFLNEIDSRTIAFDFETTGLKPHAEGHKIICASVADTIDHAYVFMMPESRKERKPFTDLLANGSIEKWAHNIKFEDTWSLIQLKQRVENWAWDSMQAAHIIDNREGISNLKFQTYVNFGIVDYASDIAPYLEGDKKNANSFNKIIELIKTQQDINKLLHYCALDSIYEFRLAIQQQEIIKSDFLPF